MKDTCNNKAKIITLNTIYLLLGRIMTGLFSLLLMSVIARKLGLDKFGTYTLALTIAGIFGVVSDFGSSYLTIREVAKDKTKTGQYLFNGTIVKILLNIPFLFILFVCINCFYSTDDVKSAIYLASVASMFNVFAQFVMSFFNAFEKMHFTSAFSALQSFLLFSASFVILLMSIKSINYIFYGHIIVNVMMTLLSIVLLFKIISPKIGYFDASFSRRFFKKSIPFGLFFLGGVIYFQTDTIMLSVMKDKSTVGLYQAAIRLVMIFDTIPMLLSTAMYPTICRTFLQSKTEAEMMMVKLFKYMLVISLPFAMGIALLSKEIIFVVYGEKFMLSILLLEILAWVIPIRFCCHILGTTLSASNNQDFRAIATGITALLNIGLNIILIPRFSYNGAAIASVISCGVLMVFYCYSIKTVFNHITLYKTILSPLVSILIFAAIVYFLKGINVFAVIVIGTAAYFFSLILFKGINVDDFRMLKQLFLSEKTPNI